MLILVCLAVLFSGLRATVPVQIFLENCKAGNFDGMKLFLDNNNPDPQTHKLCLKAISRSSTASTVLIKYLTHEKFIFSEAEIPNWKYSDQITELQEQKDLMRTWLNDEFEWTNMLEEDLDARNEYFSRLKKKRSVNLIELSLGLDTNQYLHKFYVEALKEAVHYGDIGLASLMRYKARKELPGPFIPPNTSVNEAFLQACQHGDYNSYVAFMVNGLISDKSLKDNKCLKVATDYRIIHSLVFNEFVDPAEGFIAACETQNIKKMRIMMDLYKPSYETLMLCHEWAKLYDNPEMDGVYEMRLTKLKAKKEVEKRYKENLLNAVIKLKIDLQAILWVGDPFHRFQIFNHSVGSGTYGYVSLAHDMNRGGHVVAIKRIPLKERLDQIRYLTQEVTLMSRLNHPKVVSFHTACLWGENELWIVMEKMDGDLNALEKPMTEGQIANIARQLLEGLVYIHSKLLMHRDIKPGNIIFNAKGEVKWSDFGLAKVLQSKKDILVGRAGTHVYQAPEIQLQKEYTRKADIFAFGLVIYELLTGQRAIDKSDMAHSSANIAIPPGASAELQNFLSICLNPDSSQRIGARKLLGHKFITNSPVMELKLRLKKDK